VPEILPETTLRATASHPTSRLSTAPLTWAVVWGRVVLQGVVNHRRIDGKDEVAGSIPAGGSTTTPQLRPGKGPGLTRARGRIPPFARDLPARFVPCESVWGNHWVPPLPPTTTSPASLTHQSSAEYDSIVGMESAPSVARHSVSDRGRRRVDSSCAGHLVDSGLQPFRGLGVGVPGGRLPRGAGLGVSPAIAAQRERASARSVESPVSG
jgi:hypothetical protein